MRAFPRLRSRERFFSRAKPRSRKVFETTDEHGITRIFLRQSIFATSRPCARIFTLPTKENFVSHTKRPAAKISLRSHKLHVESDRSVTSPVLFFFARSREAAKFSESRMNTESHGFFYGKVFFFRVLASLRENVKSCVKSNFA